MIQIKNTQKKITIDESQLHRDTQTLLDQLEYSDFDLGIWITTNATIQRYNREYRDKDKPTDILSFPYHPDLKAGERIKVQEVDDANVGDIIISAEYVTKDAQRLNITFERRLRRLLVHGICHLLGYDHINDHDYKIMLKKERELLEKVFGKQEATAILAGE